MEQREIRFRAWHKGLKAMLYPPSIFDSMVECRDSQGKHRTIEVPDHEGEIQIRKIPAHMTWDGRMYIMGRLQDIHWLQYTGLKDKNGKEVYEGDIVRWTHRKYMGFNEKDLKQVDMSNPETMYRTVTDISFIEYIGKGFWVNAESFGWEGESLWSWEEMEVIGNIYETPQLLKNETQGT